MERRALILVNPAFAGETVTTSNLIAAFTVLDPGDRAAPAPAHLRRAAIRFATRADGAATIVDGRRCDMRAGDLILTPPMAWAWSYQPEQSPDHLVRCREHAAAASIERAFFRTRRPE